MTTVKLTGNFLATARCLIFSDASGISWAFDQNTNTLTASGTSGGGALINSTEVADSIEWNGSALQLVGDAATPGNTMLYGTNSSGVKGWYTQPGGGGGSGANPTASVGLTAVNGTATTFLRSDGAPALNVSISPTWTGVHTFSQEAVLNAGVLLANAEPVQWKDSLGGTRTVLQLFSDNNVYFDNPVSGGAINIRPNATGETWTFLSGLISSGVTGGAKGVGSINADGGYFYKGNSLNQVATAQSANTVFAGPTSGSAAQPGFRALVAADIAGLAGGSNIQTFINSGGTSQTWTKPAGCNFIKVICIAGGGGGGGGGLGVVSASVGIGGGGGSSGGISYTELRASDVASSITITFSTAAGGVGGTAATSAGNGGNATAGSHAQFGPYCMAYGGGGGFGGGTGGVADGRSLMVGVNGGAGGSGSTGTSGNADGGAFGATMASNTGGGGGGGVNIAGTAAFSGGAGGSLNNLYTPGGAGGTAGTAPGIAGGNGSSGSGIFPALGGGGGGAANGTTNGGPGGNGGNYGAGGGGGGAALTLATHAGAGGVGGPAVVIVMAW